MFTIRAHLLAHRFHQNAYQLSGSGAERMAARRDTTSRDSVRPVAKRRSIRRGRRGGRRGSGTRVDCRQ